MGEISNNINRAGMSVERPKVELEMASFPHKVKALNVSKNSGNDETFSTTSVSDHAASSNLGVPGKKTSSKPANIMNVAQPAPQAKKALKDDAVGLGPVRKEDLECGDPAFTIADLRKICHGDYNVGELKLKGNGKLDKVNNHVHGLASFNTTRLTPEQNLAVRQKVCKSLMKEYADNPRIGTVKELLLNERDRTSSLSRDEVKFLFNMLEHDAGAEPYTVANFKKLHDFKVGKLQDDTDVKPFIKGLDSKYADEDGVHDIAASVSVNARQNFVSLIFDEIVKFIRGLFRRDLKAVELIDTRLKEFGNTDYSIKHFDLRISKTDMMKIVEELKERYRLPKNIQNLESTVDSEDFAAECKKDVCTEIQKKLGVKMKEINKVQCMAEKRAEAARVLKGKEDRLSSAQRKFFDDFDFEALAKALKLPPERWVDIIPGPIVYLTSSYKVQFPFLVPDGVKSKSKWVDLLISESGKWTVQFSENEKAKKGKKA